MTRINRTAKSIFAFALIIALFSLTMVCFADPLPETEYALYAVTAGKADALLLKADDKAFLIDTGYSYTCGKILYAMKQMSITHLNGVFITHTDSDHTGGLEWLAQSNIPIDAWYASAMYTGIKEKKHPAVEAAAIRGESVRWLRAGDSYDMGNCVLEVLAPGILFEDKDNNNSLVLKLTTPYGSMLLCGDMEYPQEAWLIDSGANIDCDILKVPNHGDDDVCSPAFLQKASPTLAIISTDTTEKPETPDPALMELLAQNCEQIMQTQETTGGVYAALTSNGIEARYDALPTPATGIEPIRADSATDTITLHCSSDEPVDLSGWYMVMDRKKTLFTFPEGAVLSPGQTCTVGSLSTGGNTDYTWNEKKLINKKKADGVSLYDSNGNKIAHISNGL